MRELLDNYGFVFVGVCIGLSTSLLAGQALRRFYTVHHHTFDLALYTRLAWGLAHGDGYSSVLDQSFFALHAPFVLAPLGLLGRLFGTVQVLLVTQALCTSVTALPIYRLGVLWKSSGLGVAGALAYLLYPNLSHVACYEFHPGNLALPAIAYGLLALAQGRVRMLWLCCLTMVLCRADFALVTLMLGLLAMIEVPALRRTGGKMMVASVVAFGGSLALNGMFAHGTTSADLHFGPWGGQPFGILFKLFSEPALVVSHLSALQRLTYVPRILAPLLFLPMLAPRFLLPALPFVAINLISVFPTATQMYSHYLTPAVPTLVVAAMAGTGRMSMRLQQALPFALLLAGAVAEIAWGGTPWSLLYQAQDYRTDSSTSARIAVLAAIPAHASVQAPDPLLPHLAERPLVFRAPPPDRATRFVVLDISHRKRFVGTDTLLRTQEEPLVRYWLSRSDYGLALAVGNYLVFERGRDPRAGISARHFLLPMLAAGEGKRLSACLELMGGQRTERGVDLTLRALGSCPSDLALHFSTHEGFSRVDLLFEGLLSPAHLRRNDFIRSQHDLPISIRLRDLHVGLLRSSGARPEPGDPHAVPID